MYREIAIACVALFLSGLSALADDPPGMKQAQDGEVALHAQQFTSAIYFLKQAVQADPRHARAWGDLARAYLALDQLDAAVDACRRQIEANPRSLDAYQTLGLALWRQGKRDEAVTALRQHISLHPEDRDAMANLGRLYNQMKRYREAVPVLEKAVAVANANRLLKISLAEAYIGVGADNTEQGLALLREAVKDCNAANVWNSAAYVLAKYRFSLDQALEYAESAVTVQETFLRNGDLDHVTIAELRATENLAHNWDTLGWVHFQKGDLELAGKYLQAAWRLDTDGVIGDHLGQWEQKRGHKQAAIDAYAQALAARRPPLETRDRLVALLSDSAQIDGLVAKAAEGLGALGRLPVNPGCDAAGTAEFHLIFAQGSQGGQTVSVQFDQGDEKLRDCAKLLTSVAYPQLFPDRTAVKAFRMGSLHCPGDHAPCDLTLAPQSQAVLDDLRGEPVKTDAAVIRAGMPGVTNPKLIDRVEPEYTEIARKHRLEGTVVLYVEVDPEGKPQNLKVTRHLGDGLDEQAMKAVQRWRFSPGMKSGHPVTVAAKVEVNFRLLDKPLRR